MINRGTSPESRLCFISSFWVVFVESKDVIFSKDVIRIFLNPKKPGEALLKHWL
ncbi:MAG: hypothetical protein NT175_03080 [Bacteroidetes bacterium]|nr:hypothetical protein [Bacteroidota bacterium]